MNVTTDIYKQDCYGCGVCTIACSKKLIKIEQGKNGFYIPTIVNESECTDCGLCLNVCSFQNGKPTLNKAIIKSYGAWSKDYSVRKICSSGGVGFEIGRYLLGEGYEVVGCKYNVEKQRAEHYIAKNIEELVESIGSKYIQSYTPDAFSQIDRKKKYIVIGTPCQIDSFRRYIKRFRCEENFVLMDFFCHGVPSKLMWDKYVAEVEKIVGKLSYVSWRNKTSGLHDSRNMAIDDEDSQEKVGWHDSYNLLIKGEKGQLYSRKSQGDLFYRLFLSNLCLGMACYKDCKFKHTNSSADIRIGDFWGKTYRNNDEGVSAVFAFTEKGDDVLHKANIELLSHPIDVVAEGQIKQRIQRPILSPIMMELLKRDIPIHHVFIRAICSMQLFLKRIGSFYRLHVKHK